MDSNSLCMGCMEEKGNQSECPSCGYSERVAPDSPYYLHPRTILQNKYLVGRALGQGGFAITYLAWDLNLGIKLAIKEYFPLDLVYRIPGNNLVMAHTKAQDSIFVHDMDKFLKEARMLARFMDHPNIVSATDFFQANRTAYLVMHYIEGVTLRAHLSQSGEKLPFELTMGIMMPVMDALRVIHETGLLHRDISPENIVISKTGRVMLIDFGAARRSAVGRDDSVSVIMKPGYTPEEQYRSKGVQGPYTDIYATGATIYRSITGQMPPNSLDRLQQDTLIPPSSLGVEIDPVAEKALLKAMAVSASARFQTMIEFQEALLQKKMARAEPLQTEAKPKANQQKAKKEPDLSPPKKSEPPKQAAEPAPVVSKEERAYTSLGDIKIGRAPDNELILNDHTASRYHALIFSREGRWYIADLESTHGTIINGTRITETVELLANSEIKLSESIIRYDGINLIDQDGNILRALNEQVSFTERWFKEGSFSPGRLFEKFFTLHSSRVVDQTNTGSYAAVNIGRSADNDLVIANDMVSRYHAQIFYFGGNWYLADLQSTHGTALNGTPVIEPQEIHPADRISISEVELVYNEGSILSAQGALLYNLADAKKISSEGRADNTLSINDRLEQIMPERNWLILISAIGFTGIILILIATLM